MLEVTIPGAEFFNEETQEFYYTKETSLLLEYSLLSIAKWESRWKKPYINPFEKPTTEQTLDLIRCMTVNKNVDPILYNFLPEKIIEQINTYINDPMTATKITTFNQKTSKKMITSEEIYYWMITFGIPFECEKWHLNRLFALIEICAVKSDGGKKMSARDTAMANRELNEARKKALRTKG